MADKSVKLVDGHYTIALPLKDRHFSMPNNRIVAEQRILNLKRRFIREPSIHKDYIAFMNDLIASGFAERVPETDLERSDGKVWYIPHHGVYHPQKRKMRVVFDLEHHSKRPHSMHISCKDQTSQACWLAS